MKANTNKKNKSASRKLVPAVAMLTTSAVMLSSATYAWFTLNKNVQVTGLTMQATVSDSLEISLGNLGVNYNSADDPKPSQTAPSKDDVSWKRTILISDYYTGVGLLKPASSVDGQALYYPANDDVYAGGRNVDGASIVTAASNTDTAGLELGSTYKGSYAIKDTLQEGYYIDVPMWVRSGNTTASNVKCTVTITDPDATTENQGSYTSNELIKAVRVAIIPVGTAATSTGASGIEGLTLSGTKGTTAEQVTSYSSTASYSDKDTKVFTLNQELYRNKVLNSGGESVNYTTALTGTPSYVTAANGTESEGAIPSTTVFQIPAATKNDYAGVSFIARVWIEGESEYCNDSTANQKWNIDFKFTSEPVAQQS